MCPTKSLLLSMLVTLAWATIDINMSELEYVANHITQADCRRLVAALHSDSYELDPRVPQVGLVLSERTPCIELLIHWNSNPGEGRGKTHEVVSHRLRQLGHKELATWLSKTVSHQLARHLDQLQLPVKPCPCTTTTEPPSTTETLEDFEQEVEKQLKWTPFDSVWLSLLIVLSVIVLFLTVTVVAKKIAVHFRGKNDLNVYKRIYSEI